MPLMSIGIQLHIMFNVFCPMHPRKVNEEACQLRFSIVMGSSILVHTIIDVVLQIATKKYCDWFNRTGGVEEEAQEKPKTDAQHLPVHGRETLGVQNSASK